MYKRESKYMILKVVAISVVIVMLVVFSVKIIIWITEPTNQKVLEAWLTQIGFMGWFIVIIMQVM